MKTVFNKTATIILSLFVLLACLEVSDGLKLSDITGGGAAGASAKGSGGPKRKVPPELANCNGVFLTYSLQSRDKEFPYVKNMSKQGWSFRSEATLMNTGDETLKGWKMFLGFHHREILVSMDGAVPIDAEDLPAEVGKGVTIAGSGLTDLKTAIETAGDYNQMQVRITMMGTHFGLGWNGVPLPKTIKLINDGFKCPNPVRQGRRMSVCCRVDPKAKAKAPKKIKFLPRRYGDITIAYDVLQTFQTSYFAQVTIDNNHPLGRLDHWNLTWEWQKGEFINTLRGAYAPIKDPTECLYGPAGKYYGSLDFSTVANCQKRPILSDLPSEMQNDEKVGKIPWCCKNGTVLPPLMDKNKARSIFQLQVFKIAPDDNRTSITPPLKWKIDGVINPKYTCGTPVRVDPQQFPDPSGLKAISTAVASWQIVCNITRPKPRENRCCVSFSAFYNESAIPCNTCACGCDKVETKKCNPNARPLLIPPNSLLVPFANRTKTAKEWATMDQNKNKVPKVPKVLPCGDNCPVSINWHVSSDHKDGWSARITLFNWQDFSYDDWFTALQFERSFPEFEDVYSFNGTRIPGIKTIFFQGLKDMNYLAGETNGTHPDDPRVPGKQQSVLSFHKKHIKNFNILRDAFPTKVFFNGMECALPSQKPAKSSGNKSSFNLIAIMFTAIITFMLMTDRFF